jgi:type IX secretion system PorP/SprF family membrane protein
MRKKIWGKIMTCKSLLLVAVTCCMWLAGEAQDPVFSQAYLSPINLNPAATGTGEHDLRVSALYRRQWWTIPSQMNYMTVSIDKFLPTISSGIGLLITKSDEGYLKKTGVYASYAYTVCAGTCQPSGEWRNAQMVLDRRASVWSCAGPHRLR